MDDGSYKSKDHRALIFNTQGFNRRGIVRLQDALRKKFDIEARLRKQKDGLQLLITEPSSSRMAAIIKPHLGTEFKYKLGKVGLTLLPKE